MVHCRMMEDDCFIRFNIVGIKLLSENPLKILCIQNYIEFELYGTQLSET